MKTTRLMTVLAMALAFAIGATVPAPAFADRDRGSGRSHPAAGHAGRGVAPAHVRSGAAHVHGGYYGGGYYRPYWGPRYSVGVYLGPGFWGGYYPYYGYGPYYYPPYYGYGSYYPPAVVTVPSSPPTYIEKGAGEEAPGSPAYWYYCRDANGYYPYVKQCPGGWEQVNPTPPPAR